MPYGISQKQMRKRKTIYSLVTHGSMNLWLTLIYPVTLIHCFIFLETPGRTISLLKESTKLLKGRK